MEKIKKLKIDPLYIIFEKHLYDMPNDATDSFTYAVVSEYIEYLRELKLNTPEKHRDELFQSISEDVQEMLIKKIYGHSSVKQFRNAMSPDQNFDREMARQRYSYLKKNT